MTGRSPMELVDYVRELTCTHQHSEPYTVHRGITIVTQRHVTTVPPLLWQLEHAVPTRAGDDSALGGYRSQPAAWLESIDTLTWIDLEATRWVTDMGGQDDGTAIQVVSRLGGIVVSAHQCHRAHGVRDKDTESWCCTRHAVAHDVQQWWTQARIVTGWQSPAWRPNNTCPTCGRRGGLRVRLGDQSALCVECRATWMPATIGLLAEHIRGENAETGRPEERLVDTPRRSAGA